DVDLGESGHTSAAQRGDRFLVAAGLSKQYLALGVAEFRGETVEHLAVLVGGNPRNVERYDKTVAGQNLAVCPRRAEDAEGETDVGQGQSFRLAEPREQARDE